jgi:hypothetical protein
VSGGGSSSSGTYSYISSNPSNIQLANSSGSGTVVNANGGLGGTSMQLPNIHHQSSQYLMARLMMPTLDDVELAQLEQNRADRSQFVHSLLLSTLEEIDSLNLFGVDDDKVDDPQTPKVDVKESINGNQHPKENLSFDSGEASIGGNRNDEPLKNSSVNNQNSNAVATNNYGGVNQCRNNKRKHDFSKVNSNKNANFISKNKNDKNNNHGNVTGSGSGSGSGTSSGHPATHSIVNSPQPPPVSLPIQTSSSTLSNAVGNPTVTSSAPTTATTATTASSVVLNKTRDLKNAAGQTPAQATTAKLEDTR